MPHLLVDISSHGYGHISLTAPVLNALLHRMPELRLTIRCAAPRELLAARIAGEFEHIQRATDFGMVMENAMVVSVEQGAAAYREFHGKRRSWQRSNPICCYRIFLIWRWLRQSGRTFLLSRCARSTGRIFTYPTVPNSQKQMKYTARCWRPTPVRWRF
jgi:hypothetical protein